MWRPWTGEKKPVRPHGTQDIYYLIHIPIRFVDDEEENRDLAERKRGRTHVLASSLMTAGLSQPPFCCCCRTCCCIMASAPAFSSANRTLTLAECLRNFSQHLVTHCEEEGRTGPGSQSQCPSHSQRRSSLSLSYPLLVAVEVLPSERVHAVLEALLNEPVVHPQAVFAGKRSFRPRQQTAFRRRRRLRFLLDSKKLYRRQTPAQWAHASPVDASTPPPHRRVLPRSYLSFICILSIMLTIFCLSSSGRPSKSAGFMSATASRRLGFRS